MNCDICAKNFNQTERKPISLNCGHSICAFCLENWKKLNRACPSCRKIITNEAPNYYVIGLLEKNLIDEKTKSLHLKCNRRIDEIHSKADSIRSSVNYKAAELTSKIKFQKEYLIKETDRIQENLNERVSTILNVNSIDSEMNMEKKELEISILKLSEAEDELDFNLNELYKIESQIDESLSIGKHPSNGCDYNCVNILYY